MRTVQKIIEVKGEPSNFVSSETLVIDALSLMNNINRSYLIVTTDGAYAGIFSERDYSRNIILKGRHSNSTTVGEAMSSDVPTVSVKDSVEDCMIKMEQTKSRYLAAFDDEKNLKGVITIHDILRQFLHNKEEVFDTELAGRLLDDDENKIY